MMKLAAVMMILLFANASGGNISSLLEQDVEGKFSRSIFIFQTKFRRSLWESCLSIFSLLISEDRITTCTNFSLRRMDCDCLAMTYSRTYGCYDAGSYDPKKPCWWYEKRCEKTNKKGPCCKAIECYFVKTGC